MIGQHFKNFTSVGGQTLHVVDGTHSGNGSLNFVGNQYQAKEPLFELAVRGDSWPLPIRVDFSAHPVQQAHLLLHLLEVFGQQVRVPPAHLKRGVTEGLL